MIYTDVCEERLSTYAMGTMRLPLVDGDDSKVDYDAAEKMYDYALEHGVNYIDTAFGYHGGTSEVVTGKALARHDRSSFNIATKFPGYNTANFGHHEEIFAKQLERLQMDYVDFYLIHNVCESNIEFYLDEEKWGTEGYFKGLKEEGKIRHLGFSCHANIDNLERFLDRFGEDMEFCQLQINYLDWEFQNAKRKVELCGERGIPVWVMEPLRGGYIATLSEERMRPLKALRPDATAAEWALRWLQTKLPGSIILNGASSLEQMTENIETFSSPAPLNDEELEAISALSREMIESIGVPCTACHYCTPQCPQELDIPMLLALFNEYRSKSAKDDFIATMAIGTLDAGQKPSSCIACGSCSAVCPQSIDIPGALAELTEAIENK